MITLPWPPKELSPNASPIWTKDDDTYLARHYMTVDYKDIAKALGRSVGAVRNRRYKILPQQVGKWTNDEIELLRSEYSGKEFSEEIDLDGLANVLSRHKTNICRKARELGLTNISRRSKKCRFADCRLQGEQLVRARSAQMKAWYSENEHPRGMAGKKHTAATLQVISESSRKIWAVMSPAEKLERSTRMLKRRREVYGSLPPKAGRGSWKAGWRNIGGANVFYRSRWEANYARYLQWLKDRGEIQDWQHEPDTFWFEAIKRGVRSYLPDFKVTEVGGAIAYHEVKGWMDARSRTTIKRMGKYHPKVKLIVIEAKQYKALSKQLGRIVEGWE